MRVFVQPLLAAHFVQCALIAFWYLCTFAAAVTALNVPFPRAFKEAVRLSAARGKTWDSKPSALGWLKVLVLVISAMLVLKSIGRGFLLQLCACF